MSADFYSEKNVRDRKHHKCEVCGSVIEPGAKYIRKAGVYEGNFWNTVECEECQPIISEFLGTSYGEDGYCTDSIGEWWAEDKCHNCKKRFTVPCNHDPKACLHSADECHDRTENGMCSAEEPCDEMTRVCWCEKYEPIYRTHITNGIETVYDLAEEYLGSRDEWERIEKLNGKWLYGMWNTEGKKYRYGVTIRIPD